MTVEILRLTGLASADAPDAAHALLADFHDHPDLSRLLVLDDTAMLVQHTPVYERLVTAKRVENLLCVALGPRAGGGRALQLPGNLGGTQGSGVLWVSDPLGIDWRVATSAIAIGHTAGPVNGLDHLVELLSVDEVFDRVHAILTTNVPGKIASPGLRLAGADDEPATFAGALAVAICRLTEPGPGLDGPLPALLPSATVGASLADRGELSRCRADVVDSVNAAAAALAKLASIGGVFRRGHVSVHDHLVEAAVALSDMRNQVADLLQDADATGELTDNQHRRVLAAGVSLPGPAPAASSQPACPRRLLTVTRLPDDRRRPQGRRHARAGDEAPDDDRTRAEAPRQRQLPAGSRETVPGVPAQSAGGCTAAPEARQCQRVAARAGAG